MVTQVALFPTQWDAENVACLLRKRVTDKPCKAIYAKGWAVCIEHSGTKLPRSVTDKALAFVAGYKFAQECFSNREKNPFGL